MNCAWWFLRDSCVPELPVTYTLLTKISFLDLAGLTVFHHHQLHPTRNISVADLLTTNIEYRWEWDLYGIILSVETCNCAHQVGSSVVDRRRVQESRDGSSVLEMKQNSPFWKTVCVTSQRYFMSLCCNAWALRFSVSSLPCPSTYYYAECGIAIQHTLRFAFLLFATYQYDRITPLLN